MLMWAWPSAVAISEIAPGRFGTATTIAGGRPALAIDPADAVLGLARPRPRTPAASRGRRARAPAPTSSSRRRVAAQRLQHRLAVGQQDVGPERGVRPGHAGQVAERRPRRAQRLAPLEGRARGLVDRGPPPGRGAGGRRAPSGGRGRARRSPWAARPTDATRPWRRPNSSGRASGPGVRNQVASRKRPSRAKATPLRSAPHTGWPPMNRSRASGPSASMISALRRAEVGDDAGRAGGVEGAPGQPGERRHRSRQDHRVGARGRLLDRRGSLGDGAHLQRGREGPGIGVDARGRRVRAAPGRASRP